MPQTILKNFHFTNYSQKTPCTLTARTKKSQCKTISRIFGNTQEIHSLNDKPFRLVPVSNYTIKTHGKTKLGQACTTKMALWNSYEQLIMAKMGISKKSEQGKWLNIDNEQDFFFLSFQR